MAEAASGMAAAETCADDENSGSAHRRLGGKTPVPCFVTENGDATADSAVPSDRAARSPYPAHAAGPPARRVRNKTRHGRWARPVAAASKPAGRLPARRSPPRRRSVRYRSSGGLGRGYRRALRADGAMFGTGPENRGRRCRAAFPPTAPRCRPAAHEHPPDAVLDRTDGRARAHSRFRTNIRRSVFENVCPSTFKNPYSRPRFGRLLRPVVCFSKVGKRPDFTSCRSARNLNVCPSTAVAVVVVVGTPVSVIVGIVYRKKSRVGSPCAVVLARASRLLNYNELSSQIKMRWWR